MKIVNFIASLEWSILFDKLYGRKYKITEKQLDEIKNVLASGHFIILTSTKSHLTTYIIKLLGFLKTGKWAKYTHVLMNVDPETNIEKFKDFKFMEATGVGTHTSTFDEVFACDYVCMLKPKHLKIEEFDSILQELCNKNGTPYDGLFNILDDKKLSCVELVRVALQTVDNYDKKFRNLENSIIKYGNLTPQMYRDCEDFEVILEI